MIKKWIRKACHEYFVEFLQPQIAENKVANMEHKITAEKQIKELKRHNLLVEGWLAAFMKAQGVELPVEGKAEE